MIKFLGLQRSYIITLDSNKETKGYFAKKELEEIGLNPTIISAINGMEMELSSPKCDRAGGIGCILSHRFCLQDAVLNEFDCIAIFEDDIIKPNNWKEIENNFFSNLPDDWEMLWLGWDDRDRKVENKNNYVLYPLRPYGTQAIIYRGKEFIKQIFELSKILYHWDLALEELSHDRNIKCYLPYKTFFDQRRHLTDIYSEYRDRMKTGWYAKHDNKWKK